MTFKNQKSKKFLSSFVDTITLDKCGIENYAKFNFHFFDKTEILSKSFDEIDASLLRIIVNKLKDYSGKSLHTWKTIGCGARRRGTLAIYGQFPSHSEFNCPAHVPNDVLWGRFRINSTVRLIGFVIPDDMNGKSYDTKGRKMYLCTNTFYIVFIDLDHKFYPMK